MNALAKSGPRDAAQRDNSGTTGSHLVLQLQNNLKERVVSKQAARNIALNETYKG